MGIASVLGFGTNWERVNKRQLQEKLMEVGFIVHSILCLIIYDYDMEKYLKDEQFGHPPPKDKVYKIIKGFGPDVPTKTEYNAFSEFVSTSDLLPSARKVRKDPNFQYSWDVAYKWAMDYEYKNSNQAILDSNQEIIEAIKNSNVKTDQMILAENNKKIAELETRITKLEQKLIEYENE